MSDNVKSFQIHEGGIGMSFTKDPFNGLFFVDYAPAPGSQVCVCEIYTKKLQKHHSQKTPEFYKCYLHSHTTLLKLLSLICFPTLVSVFVLLG